MVERGTIVRVEGRLVWAEVPKLGLGVQYGPLELAIHPSLPAPAVGDRCIVGLVHGVRDDLVVLGIVG